MHRALGKTFADVRRYSLVNPELLSSGRVAELAKLTEWDLDYRPARDGQGRRWAALMRLDLPRMRPLVEARPAGDWNAPQVECSYRMGLCRGIQMGEFIRWVESGTAAS